MINKNFLLLLLSVFLISCSQDGVSVGNPVADDNAPKEEVTWASAPLTLDDPQQSSSSGFSKSVTTLQPGEYIQIMICIKDLVLHKRGGSFVIPVNDKAHYIQNGFDYDLGDFELPIGEFDSFEIQVAPVCGTLNAFEHFFMFRGNGIHWSETNASFGIHVQERVIVTKESGLTLPTNSIGVFLIRNGGQADIIEILDSTNL